MTIKYNRSSTELVNKAEALIYNKKTQMVFSKNFETSVLRNKQTTFDKFKINFFEGNNRVMLEYAYFENQSLDKNFEHSCMRINRTNVVKHRNKKSKFSKILYNFFTSFNLFLKLSLNKEGLNEQSIKDIKLLSSKIKGYLEKLELNVNKDLDLQGYEGKDLKFISVMIEKIGNFIEEIKAQVLSENVVEMVASSQE